MDEYIIKKIQDYAKPKIVYRVDMMAIDETGFRKKNNHTNSSIFINKSELRNHLQLLFKESCFDFSDYKFDINININILLNDQIIVVKSKNDYLIKISIEKIKISELDNFNYLEIFYDNSLQRIN
jgi:hypothetical protein